MLTFPHIPQIELTSDEKIWLQAVWKYILVHKKLPTYQEIRLETVKITGKNFIPSNIDKRLANNHATEITLLGVLHVSSDNKILEDANKIINYIKDQIIENPQRENFTMKEISDKLNMDESYVGIVFRMVSNYHGFFQSAGSAAGKFVYDHFSANDIHVFDKYLAFTSIEKTLDDHFKQIKEWDEAAKKRQYENEESEYHEEHAMWIDDHGDLMYNEDKLIEKIKNHEILNTKKFVDPSRIDELKAIEKKNHDFSKLIRLCEELNIAWTFGNFYSIALLTRALIDHVPPLFEYNNFNEVTNNYKADKNERTFKKSMEHLNNSLRNIGDSCIHSQIRRSESLPNATQVDFKNDLDLLLGEIVRISC